MKNIRDSQNLGYIVVTSSPKKTSQFPIKPCFLKMRRKLELAAIYWQL